MADSPSHKQNSGHIEDDRQGADVAGQSSAVSSDIQRVADEQAAAVGLVVESVQLRKAGGRTLLTVTVDLPETEVGSAHLDTVAEVSRGISAVFDDKNIMGETPYVLEVTTPGADRPLTEPRHFRRARTRLVTITLRDDSTVKGRLVEADDQGVTLQKAKSEQHIAWSHIAKGRVELEFSRPS